MNKLLFTIFCSLPLLLTAQSKADYTWMFGSDAEPLELSEGTVFQFADDGYTIEYQPIPFEIGSNNASISDENGRLLFYTNGCAVFDSTFQIMENGDSINPGDRHDVHCPFGNYPGIQNSIIIPDPGNASGYYYFHKPIEVIIIDNDVLIEADLKYSYIDYTDNPLGRVAEKNLALDTVDRDRPWSYVEAIPHSNGVDYWLIDYTQEGDSSKYLAFLIDTAGIHLQHERIVENPQSVDDWCSASGQSCFSPDGRLLTRFCPNTGLDIYDFDRSEGSLSNYRNLHIPTNYGVCGLGISPNSRFAYVSCRDSLWQVDLHEEHLEDGLILIDTLDIEGDPLVTNFGLQQLGPDCKIYMNTIRQYKYLHVINNPDAKGKDCDFRQHSIQLPHFNQPGSFPNFPHFRVNEDQVCDPTITSVFGVPVVVDEVVSLFPNPATDHITIESEYPMDKITIKNMTGSAVYSTTSRSTRVEVDVSTLASGLYFVDVWYGDRREISKVVVE